MPASSRSAAPSLARRTPRPGPLPEGVAWLGLLAAPVALSAFFSTCGASAYQPSSPADEAGSVGTGGGPGAPPASFDPEAVRVGPASPLGRARAAVAADAGPRAPTVLTLRDAAPDASDERAELTWLLARAYARDGDRARAAAAFAELSGSPPAPGAPSAARSPLEPWAAIERAEALVERDPASALAALGPALAAASAGGFPGRLRARVVEARALARLGRRDDAVAALRALVAEAGDRPAASVAALPLATLLASAEDAASREEALALYRRVAARHALSAQGRDAERRATELFVALSPALTDERRAALAAPSPDDALARADALFDAARYEEAERDYAAAAERLAAAGRHGDACRARLQEAVGAARRRARELAVSRLLSLLAGADAARCDEDTRAWARFHAGRRLHDLGRHAEALAQFEALEREAPAHRLADDALFRAALVARDAGDLDGWRDRLAALPTRYPRGDMRAEARFLLAWALRDEGKRDDALALLATEPLLGEPDDDTLGRAAYWRARLLAELGRRAEAADTYEGLARGAPLTYYGQLAVARLREFDSARAERAIAAWSPASPRRTAPASGRPAAPPPAPGASETPLRFPHRAEHDAPGFRRLVALLRVGEHDLARSELAALGLAGEGADPDAIWLAAALLDRAGLPSDAVSLVRRRLASRLRVPPVGAARALWRIAYPAAFTPEIEDAAAAEGVPASFVRAIAREESSFDPAARSVVGALGLIQLMPETARRFATQIALPHDPRALRTAATNLRIGARFLGFLWQRYPGAAHRVPGAYNAGEAAMDRWVRQRPDAAPDEFVERIPYEESRRYTRRVLASWGIYTFLDEGRLVAF
jgi:soluble lytic murein transglycosylase